MSNENQQPKERFKVGLSQKVVFYNPETKQFLLMKDATTDSNFSKLYGQWELPGGHIEADEVDKPLEALQREITEEVGDEIQYTLKEDSIGGQLLPVPGEYTRMNVFFLGFYQEGEIKLSEEHEEYCWATLGEVESSQEYHSWLKKAVKSAAEHIQLQEYLADLQRLRADFENYKKRQQAESKEFSAHLAKSIVSDLVPVLSNLQAAAEHVPADLRESPWVTGITYIEKQFEDALKNYGVIPIEVKVGDMFNPLEHEALSLTDNQQPTTDKKFQEHKIEKVVQKGYKIGDRVIKAARVIVS